MYIVSLKPIRGYDVITSFAVDVLDKHVNVAEVTVSGQFEELKIFQNLCDQNNHRHLSK